MVRAKQDALGDRGRQRVIPILLHGDAAFAGPGHRGRDPEPRRPRGLHHGRHHPRRREQPDRLHHPAPGRALVDLLHGRGQDGPRPGLPRERRRPRGGGVRGRARPRVPAEVQEGRGHRPRLLPPLGPQRGRRAELHPAPHVLEDQEPHLGGPALRRAARAPGRRDPRGAGRAVGGQEGGDAEGGRRGTTRPASPAGRRWSCPTSTPRRCAAGCKAVLQVLSTVPAGFEIHPKLVLLREEAPGGARGEGRRGLGHRRVPGLGHAAPRGHPRAPLRPGLRPGHLQPAPRGLRTTPRRARSTCP